MLKKLMMTTALSGLMMGAALAQSSPKPMDAPAATPPAATAPAPKADTTMKPSTGTTMTRAPTSAGATQIVNSQRQDQWLASKFEGTDVIGATDEKIGDVSDILFDKTGKVDAIIVSVGGFLGMGAKDIALSPGSFEVIYGDKTKNEVDKLRITMSKDQLKQAAAFEPYKAPSSTTGMGSTSPRPAPAPAPKAQ
jgi:sporulation protein YlmC with PRC-barrel domain